MKKVKNWLNFKKFLQIFFFEILTAIEFNSFQRQSINALSYASMVGQGCLIFIRHQWDVKIGLITMKTTTNTGKNQKFKRKMREESVEDN